MTGDGVKARKRFGGRPPGARNRATLKREALANKGLDAAIEAGVLPLEVILRRMRDPKSVSAASFEAACAAAPYVHPKLSAVAYRNAAAAEVEIDLSGATDEELRVLRRFVDNAIAGRPVGFNDVAGGLVVEVEPADDGATDEA